MKLTSKKSVAATEAKLHFGEILNTCVYGGEPVIITKHDKPVAVLVNIADWQKNSAKRQESEDITPLHKRVLKMRAKMSEFLKKHPPKINPTAVELTRMGRDELEERTTKCLNNKW